ncbi:MAG: MFS transporter [Chloroflexi bacterium]|nr:MFS transporter [Chloroflexota bacterium]
MKKTSIPYRWKIVIACFGVSLCLGEAFNSFGIFLKPLQAEFGWSRAIVSSGYTALIIGYAVSAVIAGKLVDKHNPRPILVVSAFLAGLGIALCSQARDINEFRIFNFIAGMGAGATWSVPSTVVQRWFYGERKAGIALGITLSGVGVGGLVFAPLISQLILSYGWGSTYVIIGIVFFSTIAGSALVVRHPRPAEARMPAEAVVSKTKTTGGWTMGRIMKTPAFAGITFLNTSSLIAWHMIAAHLVPQAIDIGIAPMTAAAAFGLIGGISTGGRLISGFLSVRLPWRNILIISFFGMGVSMSLAVFLTNVGMLYIFAFFYGLFYGIRATSHAGILNEFFGMRFMGEILGVTAAISQPIGASGPFIAGFIFDKTGNYTIAFLIAMALLLSSGVIGTVMKKPSTGYDLVEKSVRIAG